MRVVKARKQSMGRPGKKHVRLGITAPNSRALFDGLDDEAPIAAGCDVRFLPTEFDAVNPEASYSRLISTSHRKRLGQFFTPQQIADLLCKWTAQIQPATMLDPAAGTGILARTFHRVANECQISAMEVDPLAAAALSLVAPSSWRERIIRGDFLTWANEDRFDAIVANPPYLRHHDICYPDQLWRQIEHRSGVKLSRLTNVYILFILEICRRLNPGGRAAIIVPGEWLNANFGVPLKQFLLHGGWLQQLVYFSHADTLFPDALTTACLLLIQRSHTDADKSQLRTLFVSSSTSLSQLERMVLEEGVVAEGVIERYFTPDELLAHPKWNSLLEHGLPTPIPGFVPLAELASTCRGIATGANSFFHLSLADSTTRGLGENHLKPCIGRARDVDGYVFRSNDFAQLVERNSTTHLFCAGEQLSPAERRYLTEGEQAGLPDRYLLSQRSPWYAMERREPAPIWAAVFGRRELRFVFNEAGILNLTTFHAIYPRSHDRIFAMALTACLNSPAVQERARLQHRVYGGGLLKFEPKDLLEVQVPDLRLARPETLVLLAECLTDLDDAAKAGNENLCISARSLLNGAVIMASAEAATQSPRKEVGRQSELGPLWAQRRHRADPASSPDVQPENRAAESPRLVGPS
jgi:adenine-specific DNA-methyltransferase